MKDNVPGLDNLAKDDSYEIQLHVQTYTHTHTHTY